MYCVVYYLYGNIIFAFDEFYVMVFAFVLECNCDRYGSVRVETCDVISGQCQCRPRFTGRDCSQCEVSDVIFTTSQCYSFINIIPLHYHYRGPG